MLPVALTNDVIQALSSRVHQPILAYIEARLEEVKHQLTTADEKLVKNLQGRAQELMEFKALINKARESM